jgi:hypothetical protein
MVSGLRGKHDTDAHPNGKSEIKKEVIIQPVFVQ